jgi:aminomethyltransferase
MGLKTPLYDTHVRHGAKIVDFGGWDMPLHYGSQIEEHHAVRRDAGMFDVSHMAVVDVSGDKARDFLRFLLANDVARLKTPGKALYSCMLLPSGGVLDDLIVYHRSESEFRLVVNAGTRDKDLAWIRRHAADYSVSVAFRDDLAMIAIQGPDARRKSAALLAPAQQTAALDLPAFCGAEIGEWFIARTGYTGEDGFEIMIPASGAAETWERLTAQGVRPAGLGARDTLRLEAGMNLYGNDMDEDHHPLECGLAWTVAFDPPARDFIGRDALEQARRTGGMVQVGLLLEERGVLRSHQTVRAGAGAGDASDASHTSITGGAGGAGDSGDTGDTRNAESTRNIGTTSDARNTSNAGDTGNTGEVTSGTFSPTLNRSIALARVPRDFAGTVQVEIRGKLHAARIVKPPFVRHGKSLIDI